MAATLPLMAPSLAPSPRPESTAGHPARHAGRSPRTCDSTTCRSGPSTRASAPASAATRAPPPPPPTNVPVLEENSVNAALPMRERLSQHRSNPVCASCHTTIDPVGFALENFDALGRWRDQHADSGAIDASGGLPGVGDVDGVAGLEAGLLRRPALFAGRVTEKLLTFALGRGVEYFDAPAIPRFFAMQSRTTIALRRSSSGL